jgi:hypothetical protein
MTLHGDFDDRGLPTPDPDLAPPPAPIRESSSPDYSREAILLFGDEEVRGHPTCEHFDRGNERPEWKVKEELGHRRGFYESGKRRFA